jgi:hypothetical protein
VISAGGPYLCGPITLGNKVNLQVDYGAIVDAKGTVKKYLGV